MPSPLAHLATGYVAYKVSDPTEKYKLPTISRVPGLLAFTAGISMLPDIDSVVGILVGNFGRFHNQMSHSFFVALAVAIIVALLMEQWRGGQKRDWFLLSFACYSLHIVMDSAAVSRGVKAFWPLTNDRFLFPVTFFYGLHWSDGLFSIRHLWTFLSEMAFVGLLMLGLKLPAFSARQST